MHLCQPGGGASCGACCGLYNFRDHSRASVEAALRRQTEAVKAAPRTEEGFANVARALRAQQPPPAYPDVRVCPLLGFVDEARVGCLAHPKVTGGADLRDCGVYTADLCESFECPSFIWLTPAQARLIVAACPDWYLYGLVVTDVEFVRGLFRLLAQQAGEDVRAERILACPAALQATAAAFALKERAGDPGEQGGIFGRFAPDAAGEPSLRQIDYAALGTHAAPEDDVVLCLGYDLGTVEALNQGRRIVRDHVRAIAAALTAK